MGITLCYGAGCLDDDYDDGCTPPPEEPIATKMMPMMARPPALTIPA